MDRETLLGILLLLLGGMALQPLAAMRDQHHRVDDPCIAERRAWRRLWLPMMPSAIIAAWLAGWALREPDPVHDRLAPWLLAAICFPFALIAARAVLRAVWALVREPAAHPVCTAGLLHPRIVFSPFLVASLEDPQVRAAWEHEQAHVRHRDPLRIWLGQFVTDLQWPWPGARERFDHWVEVLEQARDDEARRHGVSGVDLAAAVVVTLKYSSRDRPGQATVRPRLLVDAALGGDPKVLERRIMRLLAARESADPLIPPGPHRASLPLAVACTLLAALLLGALYGESVLHPMLAWTCLL